VIEAFVWWWETGMIWGFTEGMGGTAGSQL